MIRKENIEDIVALTALQEGMLYHFIQNPTDQQYIEQLRFDISGSLQVEHFKTAWDYTVKSNEMLRSLFRWEKLNNPVRLVLKSHEVAFQVLSSDDSEDEALFLDSLAEENRKRGFTLTDVPFRVTLIKRRNDSFRMVLDYHHILFDGWSTGIILKEFFQFLNEAASGRSLQTISKVPFKEFIAHTNRIEIDTHRAYWRDLLNGFQEASELPFSNPKYRTKGIQKSRRLCLSAEEYAALDAYLRRNNITLASFCYTLWGALIGSFTYSDDVVLGVVASGRSGLPGKFDNVVGLFINSVPCRVKLSGNNTIVEAAKNTAGQINGLGVFENTPLPEIQASADIDTHSPLFKSLFVVENYPLDAIAEGLENVTLDAYGYDEETNFPLTITVRNVDHLDLHFQYDSNMFTEEAVIRMMDYFVYGLQQAVANDNCTIKELTWLDGTQLIEQVEQFNSTELAIDHKQTFLDLFRENAINLKHDTALFFGDNAYTFGELDELSDQLAGYLQKRINVGKGELVVVHLNRSEWIYIAPLAIIKLGAASIPVDPKTPISRVNQIVQDSGAAFVLNDDELEIFKQESDDNYKIVRSENPDPEDVAYVIYTSGSTGIPKGVQVEHHSLLNFIHAMKDWFPVDASKTILSLTTNAFDVFVFESLLPLATGMKILVASEEERLDGEKLCKLLRRTPADIAQMTPSRLSALTNFPEFFANLDFLLIAGEEFPNHLVKEVKSVFSGKLFNMYGPTETTVYATGRDLSGFNGVDIGKPIGNTQTYIVDKNGNMLPPEAKGELCIAGEGVARGYLNKEELTKEKFVKHPLYEEKIMYRTGDLACWKQDGNLDFLGRLDDQVKIRGYRIELGEIDEHLKQFIAINETITVAIGTGGEKEICSYFTSSQPLEAKELKHFLAERLPDYMIPGYFVRLDDIPLTSSGKINRKELPLPTFSRNSEYLAPTTETEKLLATIWADVLQIKEEVIGVKSGFFELGGHSLKVTKLVSRIHKGFHVKMDIALIFEAPTIRKQAELIDRLRQADSEEKFQSIPKTAKKSSYKMSLAQTRIYILQQLDPASVAYNMPIQLTLVDSLDFGKVSHAFERLIARHESLRTVFRMEDLEPRQTVLDSVPFTMNHVVSVHSDLAGVLRSFIAPFDLETGPLFRVSYVSVADGSDLLLIDMHHIITDGVSQQLLEQEFWQLYNGLELPEVAYQYRDYSEWFWSATQQEQIASQKSYWLDRFSGELPLLNLPYDYRRPSLKNYEGSRVDFVLSESDLQGLRVLCEQQEATLYMGLLSVFSTWLWKLSGQDDLVVGSPIAGRRHSDLDGIMGMFVNTLAIRTAVDGNARFSSLLSSIRENTLSAYAHQEYGFEELVESLKLSRDTGRNPLFDVMLILQNQSTVKTDRPYEVSEVSRSEGQSKFDVSMMAEERGNDLYVSLSYSTQLFRSESIERFVGYFRKILTSLSVDPVLSTISILSAEETHYQLQTLNATDTPVPKDTVVDLLNKRVSEHPDDPALLVGERSYTYKQLATGSNGVANYLHSKGIGSGDRVGVLLKRDERLVMSLLGVLKSGASYVPIDPSYPEDRIEYLVSDSACSCIIDASLWESDVFEDTRAVFSPTIDWDQPAYIIYTSGSTGLPKGVMITHGNLRSFLEWCFEEFRDEHFELVYGVTSVCFDLSVFELFYSLCSGTPVRLLESALEIEARLPGDRNVLLNTVPSVLGGLLKGGVSLSHVSVLNLAGEPIPQSYIDQLDCSRIRVRNLYGPSEDTTYSTCYPLDGEGEILIGRPISNTQAYVLDGWNNLVPMGSVGELCLSGLGLSKGYLHRESLTGEKFIDHPFQEGERLYRTGDLVQWTASGDLRYLGRKDDQVKLRGYRIELGEIETALSRHPEITEVVVNVSGTGDNSLLGAYYVAPTTVEKTVLQSFLMDQLPAYMIPAFFVKIDEIPVNNNGKINRKALPAYDFTGAEEIVAPENKTETDIRKIWADVLEIPEDNISTATSFFELGGQSLKATVMVARVHKETGIKIPLMEVFKTPTITGVSQYVLALTTIHKEASDEKQAKSILRI